MWLWLKTFVAKTMVAIGVDWPNMADGDKLNAVIGSGIGLIGIALGYLAYKVTKRQGEIAETQHQIFTEQQSKKTDLRLMAQTVDTKYGSDIELRSTITFRVHNGGNKSADGFYWELLVPESLSNIIKFVDETGQTFDGKICHISETETYFRVDDHYTRRLFPLSGIEVATIAFRHQNERLEEFTLKWRIRGEDGMIPPKGLAFIKFARIDDGTYSWSEWHPGQKEEDTQ